MAGLDVTEVLDDPDFADTLFCLRNAQTISASGIATNQPTRKGFVGVVTSAEGSTLSRLAEGSRVAAAITVHSVFRLNEGKPGQDADIVEWCGYRYTVIGVDSYSHFGRGFTRAKCELIPLRG